MFRTIRSIIAQRQQSEALRDLAWSYSELAGAKLLAIRAGIERNRTYVSEMATVFHIIRLAAEKQKLKMPAKKKGTVSLLLTSNHRFYGGLESRLTQFFLARTSISYGELFVVGRSGEIYVKGLVARPEFRSFIFDDDLPTARELQDLADQIEPYSRVFVYYSKLATVLLQRPVVVELGGLVDIPIVADPRSNYYIFEPELTEMVNFFEGEITRVLLQQTFLESELARTAARLVSMEQVQGNVNSELRKIQSEIYRANQAAASSKTLEMEGAYLAHHRAYGRAHV
ncbi:MAG: ATP synthase gamma chain [Microgenomates group bacterium GW2011_GWA1_48_10]|uniref:ATP synthase gamma chain n=1 Tax=Candidatus Gottesmanbacteria bacterium RIFCSPHIGHO2_01_FULL_47_48 TaxID=1798381 RepID=A0A1F6A3X0_9BACT|nr:MAG: ATP synthase gamma chain [Microgenomates group bacterium GW2011_GWA1_48_10]OGG19420.1 MAG: hypothetical protein A2721_02740 [Candidatus Gottesmanbacteria bacterium RIFCSPHIGHO2_01_FULL_47_48]